MRSAWRSAVANASSGLQLPDEADEALVRLRTLFAEGGLPDDLHFVLNLAGVSTTAFLLLRYFVLEGDKERAKSERLLLNVLPASVAARLRDSEGTIADGFDEVTVLFADIVDFTTMSATAAPEEVVELLNGLFSWFDRLAEKHGLEKIKTIGDAYMVAGGLPVPRADMLRRLLRWRSK